MSTSERRQKVKKKNKETYYAVRRGYKSGIYKTWDECKKQVIGFNAAIYRKFHNEDDAKEFVSGNYKESETKLSDEMKSKLRYDGFNIDEDYSIDNWNKFNGRNNLYIFTDGSLKRLEKGKMPISRYSIYFGEKCLNVSQGLPGSTNNQCELTAILNTLKIILKHKKELKSRMDKSLLDNTNNGETDEELNMLYIENIIIVTDSEYSFNACKYNINKWSDNGWIKQNGEEVKNQDILKPILFNLKKLKLFNVNVDFTHYNSHEPPPLANKYEYFLWMGNKIADFLAAET